MCLLLASIGVLMVGGINYPLKQQTDAFLQIGIIADLLEKGTYISYFGVYYYGVCALMISIISGLNIFEGNAAVQYSIVLVNLSCFIAALIGLWRVGTRLGFSPLGSLLLLTLFATNPVIQGQFRYVRCENLIVPLAIWLVYALLTISGRGDTSLRKIIIAAFLLALAITQKITALALLPSAIILLVYRRQPKLQLRPTIQFLVLSICFTSVLWVLHYEHTGIPFYQSNAETYHYEGENFENKPTADVMLRVNPVDAWRYPLQHEQRDSMANILLLDLFGDYRETRYNYPVRGESLSERSSNSSAMERARFGLVLSLLFFGIYAYALWPSSGFQSLKETSRKGSMLDKLCFGKISGLYKINMYYGFLLCALGHIALLVVASYFNTFNPEKFDIIKWEYISWSLVFYLIPIVGKTSPTEANTAPGVTNVLLTVICVGGLIQSIY